MYCLGPCHRCSFHREPECRSLSVQGHLREVLGPEQPALLQDAGWSRDRGLGPGPAPGGQPPPHRGGRHGAQVSVIQE